MAGKPTSSMISRASSRLCAKPPCGTASPMRRMAAANCSRSSAIWMARSSAPMSSTPYFSRTPWCSRSRARLRAVWPPIVGRSASGRSFSMMRAIQSGVRGSM